MSTPVFAPCAPTAPTAPLVDALRTPDSSSPALSQGPFAAPFVAPFVTPLVTRIAPSPTGHFHLGTGRTAYFNWLAARASAGTFILRIDDTDQARNQADKLAVIYQAMDYLKLDFDHTFKQSDRLDRYAQVAGQLLDQGRAVRKAGAVFLSCPLPADVVGFQDAAAGAVPLTALDRDCIDKLVLLRSDGMPTYHFANVVDDMDHGVNLVLRGADHICNTMRQVALYHALGAPLPSYAHVGLLHALDTGKKLSKSAGAPSILDYRDQGVDPDALCNFLLRLGWGPRVDDRSTTVIDRDRAQQLFLSGGRMRAAASKVDFQMLTKLDRRYKALRDSRAA